MKKVNAVVKYPNVLIYADPPYVIDAMQGKRKQYNCEMTDEDYAALLEVLRAHKGPVLLSGYDSALYDDLLRGWNRETISALAQASDKRAKVLWMNFEPEGQASLFEGGTGA